MAIRGAKKKENKPLYRAVWWWVEIADEQLKLIMECMMPYLAKLWNLARTERLALDEKIRERLEREVHPLVREAKKDDEEAGYGDMWKKKNAKVSDDEWLEQDVPNDRVQKRSKLKNLLSSVYTQETFKYLGFDRLEAEARERAIEAGYPDLWDEKNRRVKKEEWLEMGVPENLVKERIKWSFRRYDKELMLKHQINSLTNLRNSDENHVAIRRTCQEETLKTLHGAWLSFVMLRAAGDKDARSPGEREENGFFHAISNRTSFSVDLKEGTLKVVLGDFMDPLVFPIPTWRDSASWLRDEMFKKACKFRQVILSRRAEEGNRREPDLSKPGKIRISISFDIPKPPEVPQSPRNTVYLAIGGSAIGVKSAKGEEVIHIAVPDKFHRGV